MNEDDKNRINARYDERLNIKGYNIDGLASGDKTRRELRFEILRQVGIESGCRVLDVGCGLADFKSYLESCSVEVDYVGVDINPNLIHECKLRHPNAQFAVADIEEENLGQFDYVVSSSSFNLRLVKQDNYELMSSIMASMFQHASRGVAIDMMSSWVDFKGDPETAFYYDPARVFNQAKLITKRVQLRHDYPLFEFCVYLFPDFKGWGNASD